jgi:hypothetical protein
MAGQSQREIAREEGINRETVGRILSQPAFKAAIEQTQMALMDMRNDALASMRHNLKKRNVQATLGYFKGLQVFVSREKITHDGPVDELLDRADVKGRSEQEIAYFIEHGKWPEDDPAAGS